MNINGECYSLFELNQRIRNALAVSFSESVWIRAEISEIRENANGHCYLELIEKEEGSDRISAKAKATVWSFTYRMLKPYFESVAGEPLRAGMKIMAACSVEFHEVFGLSLNISDIDPAYTLGEMALRRQQIMQQLEDEGIVNMNRELPFPAVPQRIAIITSENAAGFGDFVHQLNGNQFGYCFYYKLFPAVMQGDKAEVSLVEALDRVYTFNEFFDVVVIIRGGGATADLSCFDRYLPAVHCAQFPLPVLCGIGHQRDETILDRVAYASLKTPTAVAEYLIAGMQAAHGVLAAIKTAIVDNMEERLIDKERLLKSFLLRFPQQLAGRTDDSRMLLMAKIMELRQVCRNVLDAEQRILSGSITGLSGTVRDTVSALNHNMELTEQKFAYVNPQAVMQRGYTMTYKDGLRVTSAHSLEPGEPITTVFPDGAKESVVR
jgi:exodeoxyribonuclease VII large subunit